LLRLLDNHPLLAVLPEESQFFPLLSQRALTRWVTRAAEVLDSPTLLRVLGTAPLARLAFPDRNQLATRLTHWAHDVAPQAPRIPALVEEILRSTRGPETYWTAFLTLFQRLTGIDPAGKQYWVEKTPWNELFVPVIERLVGPECRYLHMIRDPRAVIASTLRPDLTGAARDRLVVRRCILWSRSVHWYRYFSRALPSRYLALRYEDLVTRTEDAMRDVCRFLNISTEESVTTATRLGLPVSPNTAFPASAAAGVVFSSHLRRYETVLTSGERRLIEQLLGPQMIACGYTAPGHGGVSWRLALTALTPHTRRDGRTTLLALKVARRQRQYVGLRLALREVGSPPEPVHVRP
jgi:hypothetical protein